MTKRRKKMEEELNKLLLKQTEIEERIMELQEQITEETNTEIHEMVHAAKLTPEQLAAVLASLKHGVLPGNNTDSANDEEDKENEY